MTFLYLQSRFSFQKQIGQIEKSKKFTYDDRVKVENKIVRTDFHRVSGKIGRNTRFWRDKSTCQVSECRIAYNIKAREKMKGLEKLGQ